MSSDENLVVTPEPAKKNRGRIQALIIISVVLLPMVTAYVMFHAGIGIPNSTINKGDLLDPPQAISDTQLHTLEGTAWDVHAQPKKWRLLIPGLRDCNETCKQNLYLTRQVHIRLAEKAGRVERWYLLLDEQLSPATQDFLNSEHPHMPVMQVAAHEFKQLLASTNLPEHAIADGRYFLMDQEGFIMMSYDPQHQGKELLDDIKRMLKYSYEE